MFEEFAGLPLHPLAVHAAVVFVPLSAIASVLYAVVPKLRTRLGWVAVTLAVLASAAATVAVLSGDQFQQGRGLLLEGALEQHRDIGLTTLFATLVLAALTFALVTLRRYPASSRARMFLAGGLTALLVLAAAVALFYVIRAGDTGARMVWEPLW